VIKCKSIGSVGKQFHAQGAAVEKDLSLIFHLTLCTSSHCGKVEKSRAREISGACPLQN